MLTVTNLASLTAAMPTLAGSPTATAAPSVPTLGECGKVNVFYTGFPPYDPLVEAQGWNPVRVDIGLRNDTQTLINADYNVHFVWAGTETPITVMEDRLKQKGVDYDLVGIGWGMRSTVFEIIFRCFEDLIDIYKRNLPQAPIVLNYSPESTLWSVAHKISMREDCAAVGKSGKLLGYEKICDERCDKPKEKKHDDLKIP